MQNALTTFQSSQGSAVVPARYRAFYKALEKSLNEICMTSQEFVAIRTEAVYQWYTKNKPKPPGAAGQQQGQITSAEENAKAPSATASSSAARSADAGGDGKSATGPFTGDGLTRVRSPTRSKTPVMGSHNDVVVSTGMIRIFRCMLQRPRCAARLMAGHLCSMAGHLCSMSTSNGRRLQSADPASRAL
jgi:hypothetical protein